MHQPESTVLAGVACVCDGESPIVRRGMGGSGLVAMVNYGRKKQCEVRDEVFQGPPNFVLDVFDSADDEDFLRRRDRLHRTRCLASCRLQLMAMRTWIGLLALRDSWEPSGVSAV